MKVDLGEPIALKPLPPLKVGDRVTRWLCGTIPMPMTVLRVTPELITCGGPEYPGGEWDFEPKHGIEHDPYITDNLPPGAIISYIVPMTKEGEA